MNINSYFDIQGKFYSRERVRSKKSSIIIMPKNSQQDGSSQIKLSLYNNNISKESLLVCILSLLSRWKEVSADSVLYRAFYDELEGTGVRIFISFSSTCRLTQEEGQVILGEAVRLFNDILEVNAYTVQTNEVNFDDLLSLQDEQQVLDFSKEKEHDMDYSFTSITQGTILEKFHGLPQVKANKEVTDLKGRIQEVDSDLLLNETKKSEKRKEILNLEVILEDKQELLLADEKEQKESKKEIVRLEIKIEEMNYQLLSSERIKKDNQKELVKLEKQLQEASTQLLTDEILQEKTQEELIELEEQLEKVTSQLITDEKSQSDNQKELNELKRQLSEANNQLTMSEELKYKNQKEITALEEQLNEVNSQLVANETLQNENEIKLVELETRLDEATVQLVSDAKLQSENEQELSELDEQIDEANAQLISNEKSQGENQKELNELETQLDGVNRQLLADKKLQTENQKALMRLEARLEEANAQLLEDEKLKNQNQKELIELETELEKTDTQLLENEKKQNENQKEIIKLEIKLEKANAQLLEGKMLEEQSQKERVRLETELGDVGSQLLHYEDLYSEKEVDENQEEVIEVEINSLEEQEVQADEELLNKDQEASNDIEVDQKVLTKEYLYSSLAMDESDQWSVEKISDQAEVRTNTWEKFYENSQNNYHKVKGTDDEKNIKTQPVSKIAPKNKVAQPLTREEATIEDLFLNFDSSRTNKTVSIDRKQYNHYINNIKYLNLRWQKYSSNQLESNQNKFQKTFSTYVDDVDVIVAEVLNTARSNKLNKKKVVLNIDDLKILEAYEALSNYLA